MGIGSKRSTHNLVLSFICAVMLSLLQGQGGFAQEPEQPEGEWIDLFNGTDWKGGRSKLLGCLSVRTTRTRFESKTGFLNVSTMTTRSSMDDTGISTPIFPIRITN